MASLRQRWNPVTGFRLSSTLLGSGIALSLTDREHLERESKRSVAIRFLNRRILDFAAIFVRGSLQARDCAVFSVVAGPQDRLLRDFRRREGIDSGEGFIGPVSLGFVRHQVAFGVPDTSRFALLFRT